MVLDLQGDAHTLHSMFPCWTLVRLNEMLREHKGNMKGAIKAITAEAERSPGDDLSVAIVGGGIGGLALALALQNRGVSCRVFERDRHFDQRRQGYGLTMQQGTSALRSLGFTINAGDNEGVHSTRHVVLTSDGRKVGEWGQRKWGRDAEKQSASKSNFHIPRQALRQLLLDALRPGTVIWGHRFAGFAEPEDAARPRATTLSPFLKPRVHKYCDANLHCGRRFVLDSIVSPVIQALDCELQPAAFELEALHDECLKPQSMRASCFPKQTVEFTTEDGSIVSHTAHVVVGCDGINGSVRKHLASDECCPLQYLGVIVVLGIVDNLPDGSPGSDIADGRSAFQMSDSTTRLFGMPFDATRTMWQLSWPMDQDAATQLSKEGVAALKDAALERCGNWAAPVPQLLRATMVEQLSGYPVFDRAQVNKVCFERRDSAGTAVTLLGDAAHPMSPFKGQGANQALLDAVVLARELGRCGGDGPLPALRRYEAEMFERSASKVLASREAASFLHSDLAIGEGDRTRAAMARPAGEESVVSAKRSVVSATRSRAYITPTPVTGRVLEWKGKYGLIALDEMVDHPAALKRSGKVYVSAQQLVSGKGLAVGQQCRFQLWEDTKGLSAAECAGF
mmetsp:Transcript_21685/g.61450  ORF Transcript_21685/g.61450 Transcript_21685/m.61450 type:complete len:623 (-) Transcript_21685:208-2076(-)